MGPFAPLRRLLIRNPVVEYTYAKEDRVVASCDYRRVGEPLQESEGPRRTLAPSDRVAAERGDEDRGGLRGHWIQPGLGAQNSPPLQRVGRGCSWRSSSFQSGCQAEGSLGRAGAYAQVRTVARSGGVDRRAHQLSLVAPGGGMRFRTLFIRIPYD